MQLHAQVEMTWWRQLLRIMAWPGVGVGILWGNQVWLGKPCALLDIGDWWIG